MVKKISKFRKIFPDIIYNSIDVEKFINIVMISGKKTVARNIVYKSFNYIKKKYKKNPIQVFSLALDNTAPLIEPAPKRYGRKIRYKEVKMNRRKSLSMKWIVKYSKFRKEKFMYLKLAKELIDAFLKKGDAIKKRNSFHKVFNLKKKKQ
ncbi:MAG: small ribosomal subunit protein uS7 [Candidatus Nasuia deltocephalinicola]